MKKAIVFNSSPNMDKGGTSLILTPFIEGMKKGGAEVELFYNYKLNIKPCLGEFSCWLKTPGHCIRKDDMDIIYPKISEADIIVFGTPIYVDGMTGLLKTMIDRMIPLFDPFFEIRDNHCRHARTMGVKSSKIVLVSVCGFHEIDNFIPLVEHIRALSKNMDGEFSGSLLRPHVGAISYLQKKGDTVEHILKAAYNAGYDLVENGKMDYQDLKSISSELIGRDEYVKLINNNFKTIMEW